MRFVVIGAGAIGGVLGGRLHQAGYDVVLVARGHHGEAIARDGLTVRSPTGDDHLRLDVVPSIDQIDYRADDIVLLTVKSQDAVAALEDLASAAGARQAVVCVQNGVNNEREALRRFSRVYGAVVMCPTVHTEPGVVLANSSPVTGIIDVGRYPAGTDSLVDRVVGALEASTFSAHALDDVMRWKWAKLIVNLGNAIEAVCGPAARGGPINDLVRAEARAVLAAADIDAVTEEEDAARRGKLLTLGTIDGKHRPGGSTWQSLARSAGSVESDYLNGEIVMLGRLHGINTPANAALLRHIHALVRDSGPPGSVSEADVLADIVMAS